MRKQLEKQYAEAVKVHTKNRKAYRAALAAKDKANAVARKACSDASDSANVTAALKAAIDKLPPEKAAA